MTRTILLSMGLAVALPGLILARSAAAGDEPVAKTTAAPEAKTAAPAITDAAALDDDILAVLALPLAADDARDAGVEASEVEAAIDAVDAAGGSPGDASEILAAEAEATRKRGPKKGFGVWVRSQVAEGKHGKELAGLIAKKKVEYAEMTAEQKAECDAKLATLKADWVERRKQLHARRRELIASGKKTVRVGEAELAVLEKKLAKNDKRQKRIEEAIAADPTRKDALEKLLKKAERRQAKVENEIENRPADAVSTADADADGGKKEELKAKLEDKKAAQDEKKDAKKAEKKADHDAKHDGHGGHGGHGEGKGG